MAASPWGSGAPYGPMFPSDIDGLLVRLEKATERLLGPLSPQVVTADGAADDGRGRSEQIAGSCREDLGTAAKAMESLCQAVIPRDSWAERIWADWRLRSVLLQLLAAPAMRSQAAPTPPPASQADVAEHICAFRLQLLRLCRVLLRADAEVLGRGRVEPESSRSSSAGGGTSSSSGRSGEQQRTGAAGLAAAACLPLHESLQLQALRFGCAVLRMGVLPCCSGQLAAVCMSQVQGEHGAEMQQGQRPQDDPQQQQQQQHGSGQDEQHATAQDGERGQGRGCSGGAEEPVPPQDVVRAALGLTQGLVALAQAALGVLEGEGPAAGAAAARRERRQLCRRLVLLLAAGLRDSHVLDHGARATLATITNSLAAEGGGAGGRGSGEEAAVALLLAGLNHMLRGVSSLHAQITQAEHSPLASNAVGPALAQALAGPCVAHYCLVAGLRCLCAADCGPEYGMPLSYRALPVEWCGGRCSSSCCGLPAVGHRNIGNMVRLLTATDRRAQLQQLLGGAGPPLVLLLRACDLAVRSAAAHRGEVWAGGLGGAVGRELKGVLQVDGLLPVALEVLLGIDKLLKLSWEQLRCTAAGGVGGGAEAAAARVEQVGSELGFENAGNVGPGTESSAAAWGHDDEPDGGRALRSVSGIGGGEGAAEDGSEAEPAAVGSNCGTLERPAVGQGRQGAGAVRVGAPAPLASVRPRPYRLTQAELSKYEVRRWACVYGTVQHVVPLLLESQQDGSVRRVGVDLRRSLAEWLAMEDMGLPDPRTASLTASPPPVLAAALEAGLLPCLEHLVRRTGQDLAGRSFLSDVTVKWGRGPLLSGGFLWPLAYGDVGQSLGLLSAVAEALPQGAAQPGAAEADLEGTMVLLLIAVFLLGFNFSILANSHPRTWRFGSPSSSPPPAPPSGGCGPPPLAAAPPLPAGLPRLELVAAHAVRLLLPRLSRLLCGLAGTAHQGRGGTTVSDQILQLSRAAADSVIMWVTALISMCAPGGSSSSGGSSSNGGSTSSGGSTGCSTGGSGTGRGIGCEDSGNSNSSSSSSSSSIGGVINNAGSVDGGSGPHPSPTLLQGTLLRRFLLVDVRVLELLGAMLRSLPLFTAKPQASQLAGALTAAELAFGAELGHAMVAAAGRCGGAGSAGGGSGARAGARRSRSGSKAAAGSSTGPGPGPHPVWPPDLVRSLSQQLEQEGSTGYKEILKELEDTLRANLHLGSLAQQQPAGSGATQGGGGGGGDAGGGGHATWECHVPSNWSSSMVRTLYEVVGTAAGDPAWGPAGCSSS